MWATSTPYSGPLQVDGLDLDLMNPIPAVQDHIDAVANLGSRCVVVIPKGYGVPPETFGVAIYKNPKDLGQFQHMGGLNAAQAKMFLNPLRQDCA